MPCVISKSHKNWSRNLFVSKHLWVLVLVVSVNLACTINLIAVLSDVRQYCAIYCTLTCKIVCDILILHTLTLRSGDTI